MGDRRRGDGSNDKMRSFEFVYCHWKREERGSSVKWVREIETYLVQKSSATQTAELTRAASAKGAHGEAQKRKCCCMFS